MARYLVTGGAGFIGSSIAEALLARGDSVVVLDDFSTGREANVASLAGDVEVLRGDVRDEPLLDRAARGCAGIFHEAAVASVVQSVADPLRCDDVNVHGTVKVLEAARRAGIARVVFAASAAAYGDDPELPKRETMRPCPLSPYAASKVAGEHYLRVYAHLHGMKTLALRYFNVFGARQDPNGEYAAVIPKFVQALRAGRSPVVFGDGEQTRDFCHIDDVVSANLAAMSCERAAGQVVNVANGASMSVNELAAEIAKIVGRPDLRPTHAEARAGDVRHSRADITAARDLLGWEPRVKVADGLRRTVQAFPF